MSSSSVDTDSTNSADDLTARQTYNLVTDTVTGPNIRLRDNLIQGAAIAAGLVLGAVIGAIVIPDPLVGLCVGGFLGALVSLFVSGGILLVFRAVKHAGGEHD